MCVHKIGLDESLIQVKKKLSARHSQYEFYAQIDEKAGIYKEGRTGEWFELFTKTRGIWDKQEDEM